MSWKDSAAAALLVDVFRDIARQLWKAVAGETDSAAARAAIEKIVEKAIDAALPAIESGFQDQINELRIEIGLLDLTERAKDVLDAFRVKGDFPPLGIKIVEVKEITDEEREAERKAFEELRKPDE